MVKSCLTLPLMIVGVLFGVARCDSLDDLRSRLDTLASNQKAIRQEVASLSDAHDFDVSNMTRLCHSLSEKVEAQSQLLWTLQHSLNDSGSGPTSPPGNVDRRGACANGSYEIIDDVRRSSRESYDGYDEICDEKMDSGWYRFMLNGANAEMPTACVDEHRCTTDAPVWLDLRGNAMPEVGHQVEGRGCASWLGDCCKWETEVTVRNCGDFFVYHLDPTPACDLAFCAQPQGEDGHFS